MFFKLVQKSEMKRLVSMMNSGDPEMAKLAGTVLSQRQLIRWSSSSILFFHCLLLLGSITVYSWGINNHNLGWYHLPIILTIIMQAVYSFIYVKTLVECRKSYNPQLNKVDNWFS